MIKIMFIVCGIYLISCSTYPMDLAQKSLAANKLLEHKIGSEDELPAQKMDPENKSEGLHELGGANQSFSKLPQSVKDKIRERKQK